VKAQFEKITGRRGRIHYFRGLQCILQR